MGIMDMSRNGLPTCKPGFVPGCQQVPGFVPGTGYGTTETGYGDHRLWGAFRHPQILPSETINSKNLRNGILSFYLTNLIGNANVQQFDKKGH